MPQTPAANPHLIAWIDHLDEQGKSPQTIAAYRRGVQHFINWTEQTYQEPFDPLSEYGPF